MSDYTQTFRLLDFSFLQMFKTFLEIVSLQPGAMNNYVAQGMYIP